MIHLANNHPVTTDSTRNLRGIADAHDGRRSAGHMCTDAKMLRISFNAKSICYMINFFGCAITAHLG